MAKLILHVGPYTRAVKLIEKSKGFPGVTYRKKYMHNGSNYSVMFTGEFDEVELEKFLTGRVRKKTKEQ